MCLTFQSIFHSYIMWIIRRHICKIFHVYIVPRTRRQTNYFTFIRNFQLCVYITSFNFFLSLHSFLHLHFNLKKIYKKKFKLMITYIIVVITKHPHICDYRQKKNWWWCATFSLNWKYCILLNDPWQYQKSSTIHWPICVLCLNEINIWRICESI